MAEQKVNIFTFLNQIYYKKKEIPYDKKIASGYMMVLALGHINKLLPIVNKINKHLFFMPDEMIYTYFWHSVPKDKYYLKWVKKDKSDKDDRIQKMMEEYNISKREAMTLMEGL